MSKDFYKYKNIKEIIYECAKDTPDLVAYHYVEDNKEYKITFNKLWEDILSIGTLFYKRKIKEKKIAIIDVASYRWITFFLSIICGNNIVIPLNSKDNIKSVIDKVIFSDTDVVICTKEYGNILKKENALEKIEIYYIDDFAIYRDEGKQLISSGYNEYIENEVDSDAVSMIIYTSGTTSTYKGVMLCQKSMIASCIALVDTVEYGEREIILNLPINHIFAIQCVILGALYKKIPCFISGGMKYFVNEIKIIKPNIMFLVPVQAIMLAELLYGKSKEQINNLIGCVPRYIFVGGASLRDDISEKLKSVGIISLGGYGLTENNGTVSKPIVTKDYYDIKEGSVGHIIDCIEVKINNPNSNGTGEIIISGPTVFKGYYKNEIDTKNVLIDGWLYTGDIGYKDSENNLYLTGRKKTMILLSSGENVYPEELEKLVYGIVGVKECAAYAKDDKIFVDIVPEKNILSKMNIEDFYNYFKNKIKEINNVNPTYKHIYDVILREQAFDKTSTGKIIRNGK